MDESEEQPVRERIRNEEEAGPLLEQLRVEKIRNGDTTAMERLSDALESARREWSPPATSGLVGQQRLSARLRP